MLKKCSLIIFLSLNGEFRLGLENLPKNLVDGLKKYQYGVALITNQTGVDQNGRKNLDILLDKGINVKMMIVPEHGLDGKKSDEKIEDSSHKKHKIPILSSYDGNSKMRKFKKEDFKDVRVFIFDMQDSGMRHFTYISTMLKMMEVASEFNKIFIVLDRPNPLGDIMEGPLVDSGLKSFIAIESIPLRHGLTIGELAKFFNNHSMSKAVNLKIVPMKDYHRQMGLDQMHFYISPGLRSLNAVRGYSFLGLLGEVRPFEVGAKTPDTYQCIMMPEYKKIAPDVWNELKRMLKSHNIDSQFHKYKVKDTNYFGLKLSFNDINNVHGFRLLISILTLFRSMNIELKFIKNFDWSIGTRDFRKFFHEEISQEKFISKINNDLKRFYKKIKPFLIYQPEPKLVFI